MNEKSVIKPRNPLRVWLALLATFIGLLLACAVGVWHFLNSDGDIRAVAAEAEAMGITVRTVPRITTDHVRLAHARHVDALVSAIKIEYSGLHISAYTEWLPSAEFSAVHQLISSQEVRQAARGIIDLGSEPIVVNPPGWRIAPWSWDRLLSNRIVVAEVAELDLCVAANQTLIEMALREPDAWRWRSASIVFFRALLHRLPDQREHLRPVADWLDVLADRLVNLNLQLAEMILVKDLREIRSGEQFFKERGLGIPGPLEIGYPLILNLAVRLERARILKAEIDWLGFLRVHPKQPRAWLDEAGRRFAAIASEGSWLSVKSHQSALSFQHPVYFRGLLTLVLHARLIAAELRGAPWPVDVLDSSGASLRRWEKDGLVIGAYSVGPDGVDDGGDPNRDIQLRLVLEPSPAKQP